MRLLQVVQAALFGYFDCENPLAVLYLLYTLE